MRKLVEPERHHEPGEVRQLGKVLEGANRVGALPIELAAVFRRKRFRENEEAVEEVDGAERRRCEEGCTRPEMLAEEAAKRRPENKAETEGGPQHAVGLRPFLGLGHIGDVGRGRRLRRRRGAGEQAADEQHPDRLCKAHDQEVEAERAQRREQDRPAPKAVRQAAEDG